MAQQLILQPLIKSCFIFTYLMHFHLLLYMVTGVERINTLPTEVCTLRGKKNLLKVMTAA